MNPSRRTAPLIVALSASCALGLLALASGVGAASKPPPTGRVLSVSEHSSDKARQLAARHERALRELYTHLYHCLPWLEVRRNGIGFYKAKHLGSGDHRYLSLNVVIEQEPFTTLDREDRATRMFSRYVAPLLRRMTREPTLLRDPQLDGFSIILSWPRTTGSGSERPVNETMAVFLRRGLAEDFLAGRLAVGQLAKASHVLAWDGETALGPIRLTTVSDDNFVATFHLANYELEKGITCR